MKSRSWEADGNKSPGGKRMWYRRWDAMKTTATTITTTKEKVTPQTLINFGNYI